MSASMRSTCRSRSTSTSTCWAPSPSRPRTSGCPCSGSRWAGPSCTSSSATSHHHFGITVDDLEPVYRAAERRGAFDDQAFKNHLVELPGDVVQLYVRDPAGNLVEIDMKGVDRLPDDMRAVLKQLWDFHEHTEEQLSARLFVPE
jgi:hypothetical protein